MFDSPISASAYDVLGVDPAVDAETIRRAYRARLRETHPDTGGDAAAFVRVQRAWELIGTPDARAAYDRGHGFGSSSEAPGFAPTDSQWRPQARPSDTRPRARSFGQPGGWRRERYLELMREWVGRGVALEDPYDPALVRTAPAEVRQLLADALAEEATARTIADLGMGYTVWHDVLAAGRGGDVSLDHIVLGPSGLYAVASEDLGGTVTVRRGEAVAETSRREPIADLVARARAISRLTRVTFSGVILVLPDGDAPAPITELGKVRGLRATIVSQSALSTVLRRGITGAKDLGGTGLFDARTRLQQTLRFA